MQVSRLVVLHGCMASRTSSTINSMIILHHQPYSIVASLANHQIKLEEWSSCAVRTHGSCA